MDSEKAKISTTTDGKPADPGRESSGAPKPIDPVTGQHGAYWVLSEEERKKGFIRPVRHSYKHIGKNPPKNLRDLTAEEQVRFGGQGYVKYEEYDSTTGMFWTQERLDKVYRGCGAITSMGLALCETYARDPKYYGSTFCVGCKSHEPVGEFVWTEDGEVVGS